MASPSVLNLEKLLAPIPGDAPCGPDLRGSGGPTSPYYQVKDGRSAARAAERQVESGSETAATPDWKPAFTAAVNAISGAAKDLELAAYLIEAATRLYGFAGLRDGLKLAAGLVEAFWDGLYPTPDEDGIATRVAPLAGLNGIDAEGTLLAPLRTVPLTDSATHGRLTYSNYVQALATAKVLDERLKEKKIADGAMTFDKMRAAVAETPAPFVVALHDDLTECLAALAALDDALSAKCGPDAPPTSAIRGVLTSVLDAVKDVARDKLAVAMKPTAAPPADEGTATATSASGKPEPADAGGERLPTIRTRDDALNAILQLADYFRRMEPHSMVPHALEQAVRWGRMPLADLLAELIPSDDARAALFRQVGIRPPSQPGGD